MNTGWLRENWKALVMLPAALVALELFLRLVGYGAVPHDLTADGTPRAGHPYESRNVYENGVFSIVGDTVLVVGDAWTFGLGCSREETWPALLEARLHEAKPTLRLVNVADPNAKSEDTAKSLPTLMRRYKPDVIVVMTGLRDGVPLSLQTEYLARQPFGEAKRSLRPRLGFLLANLRLAWLLGSDRWEPEKKSGYTPRGATVAETQNALFTIGRTAGDQRVGVVWVAYPVRGKGGVLHAHYPLYSRNNDLIRVSSVTFGQQLVDLETRWKDGGPDDFYLPWMAWPNPSPKGHQDIAEAVAPVVASLFGIQLPTQEEKP